MRVKSIKKLCVEEEEKSLEKKGNPGIIYTDRIFMKEERKLKPCYGTAGTVPTWKNACQPAWPCSVLCDVMTSLAFLYYDADDSINSVSQKRRRPAVPPAVPSGPLRRRWKQKQD